MRTFTAFAIICPPERLAKLVGLVEKGVVSRTVGRQVFSEMMATGRDPQEIVRNGLTRIPHARHP